MSPSGCSDGQYRSKSGHCCRSCDAGTHKLKDCDQTTETQCRECGRGYFMAAENSLDKCLKCKSCNSNNNQKEKHPCTAREDTVCVCDSGFYCSEDPCDHCRPVSSCPEGYGVKTPATATSNAECAPCEAGTFSNVSDSVSRCRAHTRCEDIGRELDASGTPSADAVCGKLKTSCDWGLPAGLWVGLVLTSLTVFALVLVWRIRRRRLHREESLSQPEAPVDVVLEDEVQLKLPLPSKDLNTLYQEQTYKPLYCCEAFESDAPVKGCGAEDSTSPITPLKASMSFSECQRLNSSSSFPTSTYHRTISEPQEDEWCGT